MMNTYRCLVKTGHVGSGKHGERAIYVRAHDVPAAMAKAKRRRGVKKGGLLRSGGSVLEVMRVD